MVYLLFSAIASTTKSKGKSRSNFKEIRGQFPYLRLAFGGSWGCLGSSAGLPRTDHARQLPIT